MSEDTSLSPYDMLALQSGMATPMSAKDKAKLTKQMENFNAAQQGVVSQSKAGIRQYENLLKDLLGGTNANWDISPLAALADAWGGTDLAKTIGSRKPMTPEERQVMALKLQDELQKSKNALGQLVLGAEGKKLLAAVKGVAAENKPPTADQSKASLFGQRMLQAENNISELANSGYDPTSAKAALERTIYPEALKSESAKLQSQAEENFINAVLRRESGAAISPSEFAKGEKQYFPRIGDTPAVLEQKKANRALAIQGLKNESGPAWDKFATSSPAANVNTQEKADAMEWVKNNPDDPRVEEIRKAYQF